MRYIKFSFFVLILTFLSCRKRGCTDSDALNYSLEASKDDHSCYYFWIGQHYKGGDIFYIDKTKKHGLITATFNLQKGLNWGSAEGIDFTKITSTSVGTGANNTLNIVNTCGHETQAGSCYDLDTLGYSDWYLPSREEMRGLAISLGRLGQANLNGTYYITSSADTSGLWSVHIPTQSINIISGPGCFVRPIRSF